MLLGNPPQMVLRRNIFQIDILICPKRLIILKSNGSRTRPLPLKMLHQIPVVFEFDFFPETAGNHEIKAGAECDYDKLVGNNLFS